MNIKVDQSCFILGDDLQETLKETWRFHFPQKTIQAIISSPEKCIRVA